MEGLVWLWWLFAYWIASGFFLLILDVVYMTVIADEQMIYVKQGVEEKFFLYFVFGFVLAVVAKCAT